MSNIHPGKKPVIDEDVDDLDDVLEQFAAPPPKQSGKAKATSNVPSAATRTSAPSSSSSSSQKQTAKPPLGLDDLALTDDFTKELAEGMASLMREIAAESGSGVPGSTEGGALTEEEKERENAFRKAWEEMLVEGMNGALDVNDLGVETSGKEKGVEVEEDGFQSSIRKAMEKLKESDEKIQAESGSGGSDPLEALFSQLGEGGGESEEELQGILESMMSQLMSKDVLYEPLKELSEKFPTYLRDNDVKIKAEDRQRYISQQNIVGKILAIFENPSYSSSNHEQGARVVVLMNEMQSLGSPPPEIMGPLPPGLDVGADGMPKLPDGCCIA